MECGDSFAALNAPMIRRIFRRGKAAINAAENCRVNSGEGIAALHI